MSIQAQLTKTFRGVRSRVDTFGYLPRSFAGLISEVDQREAFEAGAHAVKIAAGGNGSITIRQGPVQRVTLITDDPKVVGVDVTDRDKGGRLIISSCRGTCWGRHHLEVQI